MEEATETRWRNYAMAEARTARNKPILEMFNEFCETYNFKFPIFKLQKFLRNTQKNVAYEVDQG